MSVEKVRAYLEHFGVSDRIREFDVSSATVEPTWWTRAASRISRAIGWTPWPTSCKQILGVSAVGRDSPLVYFSLSAAVFLVWFAKFHSFLALFSHL